MRGVTLAETILASCLLGLVMLALFNLLPGGLFAIRQGEQRIYADSLAAAWLEDLRQAPYENLNSGVYLPDPADQTVNGVTYQTRIEIYQIAGHELDRIKRIRVVVGWRFGSRDRQISQETYRANVRRP
ncbi:MAG: hypothetical protein U0931_15715 [Vulcanimicrobiota bacterium]